MRDGVVPVPDPRGGHHDRRYDGQGTSLGESQGLAAGSLFHMRMPICENDDLGTSKTVFQFVLVIKLSKLQPGWTQPAPRADPAFCFTACLWHGPAADDAEVPREVEREERHVRGVAAWEPGRAVGCIRKTYIVFFEECLSI